MMRCINCSWYWIDEGDDWDEDEEEEDEEED